MKFSITFQGNSASLNKFNIVMEEVVGQVTCLIAEGEWDKLSWLDADDFKKNDVQQLAKTFLEKCFVNSSSPEDAYNKILKGFHFDDKQFSVNRKILPMSMTNKKCIIADRYYVDTLEDLIILEMLYAIERNTSFIKCKHCGKYFASANAGATYCDRKNEDGKTCKQVAAKKTFSEAIKSDETLAIYEKAYQALYYKSRKASDENELRMHRKKMAILRHARVQYKNGEWTADKLIEVIEKNK